MDARELAFADGAIDAIVDKACVDALSCSEGFDSELSGIPRVAAECARVLRPGGGLVVLSFNGPQTMLPLLERPEWDLRHRPQGGNIWIYSARKHA